MSSNVFERNGNPFGLLVRIIVSKCAIGSWLYEKLFSCSLFVDRRVSLLFSKKVQNKDGA